MIKDTLAKLLLGQDIRNELLNSEQERDEMISKLEIANNDVVELTKESDALSEMLGKVENNFSDFKKELQSLNDILSNSSYIDEGADVFSVLQNKLSEKRTILAHIEKELNSMEKEKLQLSDKVENAKSDEEKLQNELKKLTRDLEEIESKLKEKEKQETLIAQKLTQRKAIRDKLKELRVQWQQKLEEFRNDIEKAEKSDLQQMKKKINEYERLIKNHIDIQ